MTSEESDVSFELSDRVATLTLNRPNKLNALSEAMIAGAIEPSRTLYRRSRGGRGRRNRRRACILRRRRRFCDGRRRYSTFEQRIDRQRRMHELSFMLWDMPKVTIAAVNGAAAGAGLGLALSCDLVLASERAKFTTAFAKVGFGGDFGTTFQLTQRLGPAKAKELFFLSDLLLAEDALKLGLINRVFAADAFETEVHALARRIAHGPLVSYRYMKQNVNMALDSDHRAMLEREAITHLRCGETADHREGVEAFLAKREPRFRGR